MTGTLAYNPPHRGVVWSCVSFSWVSASLALAAPASPPPEALGSGGTARGRISTRQPRSFRISAADGQWFRIQARARGVDLLLALKGPDGQTVLEGVPVVVGDTEASAPLDRAGLRRLHPGVDRLGAQHRPWARMS